ncbi:sushi, von Willebrand factor type A, EGF and pentraxin domain-containing protein 1 [Trichonephila inaurata madagascariensis]|uniref:Sushi, von Willebrand factor type A, EGF and pentraxin domain-containing protein 1 n=1 Tax=Trichonephila inaurata madagascariensis TaxID=2747483 RepID=A0A8X6YLI5_9ARAC|nr:sushi, von Willebrand factor type A, EGF and pentraxin domain-containing protein 1 [Trichonephila inaurata madagascariensis]
MSQLGVLNSLAEAQFPLYSIFTSASVNRTHITSTSFNSFWVVVDSLLSSTSASASLNTTRSLTFQGSLGLTTHSRILRFRTKSQRASRRSLDTTTITSYDSSGSGENGLHKFYKRTWENLRYEDKGSSFSNGFERPHFPVTRQETLNHPGIRGNGKRTIEGFLEASENNVNDVAALNARPDKKDKKK